MFLFHNRDTTPKSTAFIIDRIYIFPHNEYNKFNRFLLVPKGIQSGHENGSNGSGEGGGIPISGHGI